MSNLIKPFLKICLATVVAAATLFVGIVFTTALFQNEQPVGDLGRTWQDNVLIGSVLMVYIGYLIKIVFTMLSNE